MNHPLPPDRSRLAFLASVLLIAVGASPALARDWDRDSSREQLVNLRGNWRFTVGDDARWAKLDFEDDRWSRVSVPGYWEDEGYAGYNGYAWYRRSFTFDENAQQSTYLRLGQIDDTDEVFLNGKKVGGTGTFPPNYEGAWNQERVYALAPGTLKKGRNLIAVRVYDGASGGGIVGRSIGIYASNIPLPEIELSGTWKFREGDDPSYRDPSTDDSKFFSINVPSYWETARGELDGFAWYRKAFDAPQSHTGTMVLMLGKIDDTDEVYLNGTKIGGTGNLNNSDQHSDVGYYDQNRGYTFPASLLRDKNVVAVRVHDHGGRGGIYEGPIGIISQERYIEYWESIRDDRWHHTSATRWIRRLVGDHD